MRLKNADREGMKMGKVKNTKGSLVATVTTLSVLFGISGLEHGLFEILQGNTVPDRLLISAIGPMQRFWPHGTETAFTLIPNMLITGCVAMLFSTAVILWSLFGIKRKHAWTLLLALSVCQFLTGGGFAQIFLSVVISIVACRINTPLTWWSKHIPDRVRRIVAAPWQILCYIFILLFAFAIEIAVFGFPFGNTRPELAYELMMITGYLIIGTFGLTVIASLSRESLRK
jgi:hypothetical protein